MKLMRRKPEKEPNDAAGPSGVPLILSMDVLSWQEERNLLEAFWECKTELIRILLRHFTQLGSPRPPLDPWPMAQFIREHCSGKTRKVAAIRRLYDRYLQFKHRLALANVRLVTHLAKRFRHFALSYEDLMQEGVCGLMQAIDRFDPSHGTKLGTYATWWIRQALQTAVAGQSYLISLSYYHFQELGGIQRESEDLAHRENRLPSAWELAERIGINLDRLTRLQAVARTAVSLNAVLDEDSRFKLAEVMADRDSTSELLNAERAETLQLVLENLLQKLCPRERHVLELRFGLAGNEAKSLTQIGSMLGISNERVRQIQEAVLNKIRTSVDDTGWESSMFLD